MTKTVTDKHEPAPRGGTAHISDVLAEVLRDAGLANDDETNQATEGETN